MSKNLRTLVVFAVVVLGVGLLVFSRSRTAPIPPVFAERLTYAEGLARAATSGKPVFVFATADWCGPCQGFKRSTLVDPSVESLIRDRFVPVYLNVDENEDAAATLNIRGIPASIVIKDGRASAKLEGAVGSEELIAWLAKAAEPPAGN